MATKKIKERKRERGNERRENSQEGGNDRIRRREER